MSLFRRILSYGGLIAVLFFATLGPVSAATNAYSSKFITSITYMNVGAAAANLSVQFISNAGVTTNYPILNNDGSARTLARNASASLSVSVLEATTSTWTGGAIINANQPLATTMVQVSTNPTIRVRPVSNGFTASDAGATISLPYVAKACGTSKITSRINIQNVEFSTTDTLKTELYWPNGDLAYAHPDATISSVGQTFSINMASVSVSPPTSAGYKIPKECGFEGSARIYTTGGTKLVATSFEASTTGRNSASYESQISPGTSTVHMPTMLCNVNYGDGAQSSSYVIHNTSAQTSNIRIEYVYQLRATNGTLGKVTRLTTVANRLPILPNNTRTVNVCDHVPDRAVGSARIFTQIGSHAITAISKVTGNGVYAVSTGLPQSSNSTLNKVAAVVNAPYVRYSTSCFTAAPTTAVCRNESRQRTLFSVQNTSATDSIRVRMTLYNHLGVAVGSRSFVSGEIKPRGKVTISPTDVAAVTTTPINTNANAEFGYWVVGGNIVYGGSAKFEAWQVGTNAASTVPIAVTVRVINNTVLGQTAEDYNGLP
jgi:hypothetical protein